MTHAEVAFREVAADVFVLRYPIFDVNVTLVRGDGGALLVDTLSTGAQARQVAAALREVTTAPLTIVNTHHHFDHCFGNRALAGAAAAIWAHEAAARELAERPDALRRQAYEECAAHWPAIAADVAAVTVRPPDHTVHRTATVRVGDRTVELHHAGRGHTAGDLVVRVPDADVLIAGDLVEEAGPPDFGDAYPLEWPETLAELLATMGPATTVVPGHGAVVDTGFVAAQHADLTRLAWLIRDGHADGAPAEAVAGRAPYPAALATVAVRRGYAELAGAA